LPLLVQISITYRPIQGGQEVYIANLNRILTLAGWDTKVIQPYKREHADDTAVVPRIPGVQRLIPFFDTLQFAFFAAVGRIGLLNRADVILCHYAETAPLICLIPAWRKKLIVLSHGVVWNVDRMSRYDRLRERNARRLFHKVPTVANDTDYIRRMGGQAEPGKQLFSEVAPHVWFIPNCVDVELFSDENTARKATKKNPVILVPRQICEDRGIHLAIEAFALFAKKRADARLHIVGPRRLKEYWDYCQKLVEDHGLKDRVFFLPPVPNTNMAELYRRATVTVIPTLRREGTSLSALESMACGTPAVLTDVAGLKDLPGLRCEPNAEALAAGMEAALDRVDQESARQREAVQKDFCLDKWGQVWVHVLNRYAVHKSH